MGKINFGRVIAGGLLAGVVINVLEFLLNGPILGPQWAAAMESMNRAVPTGAGSTIGYIIWGFVLGIGLVWLYAAVRPRFGPGVKTAVLAGLVVWFFAWFLGFGSTVLVGMFPTNLVLVTLVWAIFELPIATAIGGWLYQEGAPEAAAPAPGP
jgi:hypothetical protein